MLIAVGLSLCYLANVWNIGAEGQFLIGAVVRQLARGASRHGSGAGPWVLPAMLLLGALGGALYALIPALLQGALRRQRNPDQPDAGLCRRAPARLSGARARGAIRRASTFPTTAEFDPVATVPMLIEGSRLHAGAVLALVVVVAAAVLLGAHHEGLRDPRRRARRRGRRASPASTPTQLTLFTFAVSGALAGLAGIIEVAGPIGHLQPGISPGYGFTAIIVAFLGRLNPLGILIAGLFLALTFIGGEGAQIVAEDAARPDQGVPGHAAVLRARLRLADPLPHPPHRAAAGRPRDGTA